MKNHYRKSGAFRGSVVRKRMALEAHLDQPRSLP
jgi:hypothetical protein